MSTSLDVGRYGGHNTIPTLKSTIKEFFPSDTRPYKQYTDTAAYELQYLLPRSSTTPTYETPISDCSASTYSQDSDDRGLCSPHSRSQVRTEDGRLYSMHFHDHSSKEMLRRRFKDMYRDIDLLRKNVDGYLSREGRQSPKASRRELRWLLNFEHDMLRILQRLREHVDKICPDDCFHRGGIKDLERKMDMERELLDDEEERVFGSTRIIIRV
ncbi:hypothetical protein EDC01DRAFT_756966 [Geopyxis carbonaria]|nr:hypothetical protein EDC01DRAFT_756966 [Geopyxis carbonaria]